MMVCTSFQDLELTTHEIINVINIARALINLIYQVPKALKMYKNLTRFTALILPGARRSLARHRVFLEH